MRTLALVSFLFAFFAHVQAVAAEPPKADPRVVADCRTEGKANELTGDALEKFVAACVAEFQSTHLSGTKALPQGK